MATVGAYFICAPPGRRLETGDSDDRRWCVPRVCRLPAVWLELARPVFALEGRWLSTPMFTFIPRR